MKIGVDYPLQVYAKNTKEAVKVLSEIVTSPRHWRFGETLTACAGIDLHLYEFWKTGKLTPDEVSRMIKTNDENIESLHFEGNAIYASFKGRNEIIPVATISNGCWSILSTKEIK